MANNLEHTIQQILRKANTRHETTITPMEELLISHLNHKRVMDIESFDGLDAVTFNPVQELGFSGMGELHLVN